MRSLRGRLVVTREDPGLARTQSGHRPPHRPVAARGAPFGDRCQPPARLLRARRIARGRIRWSYRLAGIVLGRGRPHVARTRHGTRSSLPSVSRRPRFRPLALACCGMTEADPGPPERPFWREALAPYARPHLGRSLLDIGTSIVPYAVLSALMYLVLDVSYLL